MTYNKCINNFLFSSRPVTEIVRSYNSIFVHSPKHRLLRPFTYEHFTPRCNFNTIIWSTSVLAIYKFIYALNLNLNKRFIRETEEIHNIGSLIKNKNFVAYWSCIRVHKLAPCRANPLAEAYLAQEGGSRRPARTSNLTISHKVDVKIVNA